MVNNKIIIDSYWNWLNSLYKKEWKDDEYRKLSKRYEKVFCKLKKLLSEDKVKLLAKLSDINNEIEEYMIRMCYVNGFKHGANLIMDLKGNHLAPPCKVTKKKQIESKKPRSKVTIDIHLPNIIPQHQAKQ